MSVVFKVYISGNINHFFFFILFKIINRCVEYLRLEIKIINFNYSEIFFVCLYYKSLMSSSKKKSARRKSPIKGVSLKEIDTVKKNLPPKKVINSFFKDLVSSNKKHPDEEKMELTEFCNYLNKNVSKRELREICQIINIPFYEDEKVSDTCIRIENSAGYIMSPKYINILKVLAKYSAYLLGFLLLCWCANQYGYSKTVAIKYHPFLIKQTGRIGVEVKTIYERKWVPNELLIFLATFTGTFGFLSLIGDTLGALGLNMGGIVSGFEPLKSKIRHQVFKVLGKDTRKSQGGSLKRTIKKIR